MKGASFLVCSLDGEVRLSSCESAVPISDRLRIVEAHGAASGSVELSIGRARVIPLEPDAILVIVTVPRAGLTRRQRQIAEYAASGATATEIAQCLEMSRYTVRQHLKDVYRRLEVSNRVELVHALGL